MRIWVLIGLLAISACGKFESEEGNSDAAMVDSGIDGTDLDAGIDYIPDAFVSIDAALDVSTDSAIQRSKDGGMQCELTGCDCPWLAQNCGFYTPAYPCGVSAACGQAYDVDPITCVRTVHTAITDSGACALHDDGVTWCCP